MDSITNQYITETLQKTSIFRTSKVTWKESGTVGKNLGGQNQTGVNCVCTELHIEEKKFLYARTVWLK
jgi:hypothetical protein